MYVAVELLPHGLLPKSIRTTIKQNYEDGNEFLGHLSS
jgi:hypothetical protein